MIGIYYCLSWGDNEITMSSGIIPGKGEIGCTRNRRVNAAAFAVAGSVPAFVVRCGALRPYPSAEVQRCRRPGV